MSCKDKIWFSFSISTFEEIMKYLVNSAYIIVAKDGMPLYASGKRVFALAKANFADVWLNLLESKVFILAKVFVVAITGSVTYEIFDVSL